MSAGFTDFRAAEISRPPVPGTPPNVPLLPTPTTPLRQVAPAVSAAVRVASLVRGSRVIHGKGRTVAGRLQVLGGSYGAQLLDTPDEYDAVVRLSRSVGLPAPLPDVHGLAIRIPDAYGTGRHQDLLLDSTASAPFLRRWPLPRRRPRVYSSLHSFDIGGRRRLLGARWNGDELELLTATPHRPWEVFGRLVLDDEITSAPQLQFNVWNTGGGITPVGALQEWRRRSYEASRVGSEA
jgi:hypothetical protein